LGRAHLTGPVPMSVVTVLERRAVMSIAAVHAAPRRQGLRRAAMGMSVVSHELQPAWAREAVLTESAASVCARRLPGPAAP